jgi:hypothetical protein
VPTATAPAAGAGGTTSTPPATTPGASAAARRIATEALLEVADLPAGTKAEPGSAPTTSTCAAIEGAKREATARERARHYTLPPDVDATHAVYVYRDARWAQLVFQTLSSNGTRSCLARTLEGAARRSVAASDDGTRVTGVEHITPQVPALGGVSRRFRITVRLQRGARRSPLVVEMVFTRVGRAVSISTVTDGGRAIQTFATAAGRKLAAAVTAAG